MYKNEYIKKFFKCIEMNIYKNLLIIYMKMNMHKHLCDV